MAISLDELATGTQGIVIDHAYITDITGSGFYKSRDTISDTLMRAFHDIEDQSQKHVTGYYVGWACLRDATPISDLNSASNFRELQSTWEDHKKVSQGQDGLIILSVTSQDSIPVSRQGTVTVREYTIAVCQQILHLLKIVSGDERLFNINTRDDACENDDTKQCVIYATLTLSD